MFALIVKYVCKDGMRERFLEKIREEGIDQKSRMEEGNGRYDYYFPADEDKKNELILLEIWESKEALDAHGKAPHYLRLGELKAKYVEETILEKYEK